ncbi:MAG: D-2-hydroxyacid dehydrogenase family protein, partial [Candidatus Puniceispirillaceae bacterium]
LQPYDIILAMRERTGLQVDILSQLPHLQAVITCGMRNAAIDLNYCKAKNIMVCGTESPGHATSELAMMLIGMLARDLYTSVHSMASGGWQVSTGRDLRGATLGILGLGRLGSQVAQLGMAFGMSVQAWSQNLTPDRCSEEGVSYALKDDFFSTSDFISIHLKLSDRVKGLIGVNELALMKPDACIVNTSRAPIIDQRALLAALQEKRIGGAALDVYDQEPLPTDNPFRGLPNVILTPHIGYVTAQTMAVFYGGMLEALEAYLAGQPIRCLV